MAAVLLPGTAAAQSAEPPASAAAEQERVRALVKAGALPRAALQKAEAESERMKWEQVLRDTLFRSGLTAVQVPDMLEAAAKLRQLAQEELARSVRLAEAGALPAADLKTVKERTELAEKQYDLARDRARSIQDLSTIARAETRLRELEEEDLAFHSDETLGSEWDLYWEEDLTAIEGIFLQEFGYPLPVSAQGETPMHRSLGFDHRDRFDVALHPDDLEGIFLLQLLDSWGIPYIAFRSSVPGQSTGPHIHIGPASTPLDADDTGAALDAPPPAPREPVKP